MPWIIGGSFSLSWSGARDKVRGDLWRKGSTAIPDDVVDRALHASILEIEAARNWKWLERVSATLTTEATSDNLALPSVCGPIHSLAVFVNSNPSPDPLDLAPIGDLRAWSRSATGFPTCYAILNGYAYFDCKAPTGTTFELIYEAKCPDVLGEAIATPPVTLSLHQQAVLARAKALVALEYLHDDAKANRASAAFDIHLRRMEDRDDQLRGDDTGGAIKPNDALFLAAHGR